MRTPHVRDPQGRRRIVVIGAGIVGVSCASYLLRDGHEVTLLDPLGAAEGASKGNAGALSPGSCIPLALPGVFRSIPRWLADKNGPLVIRPSYLPRVMPWLMRFAASAHPRRVGANADALRALHRPMFDCYAPLLDNAKASGLIRRSGCLVVYRNREAFDRSQLEWSMRRERGAELQILDAQEIRTLAPALAPGFSHAVLQPEHGFVTDPQRLVRTLAEQFVRDGGRFVRAAARRFEVGMEQPIRVVTDATTFATDRVVLAAGVWSRGLAASVGNPVPLESQRGYHVTLEEPNIELEIPVSSAEGKFYATPMQGGLRIAGTVEFAGLGAPANFERARRLLPQASAMFPGLGITRFTEWMGHRPCLPDSLPVIGSARKDPRIVLAFGHGHNGMTSGPVTGRIVADMIAGRPPLIDPTPYRPERFSAIRFTS